MPLSKPPIPPRPRGLRRRIPIIARPALGTILTPVPASAGLFLLLPRAEAREEHDGHAQEQEHHGRETGPHADRVECMRACVLPVHVVFDRLLYVLRQYLFIYSFFH